MRRVAFIGVGHWHRYLYMDPVLKLSDVQIVGVSDHKGNTAQHWGAELDCFSSGNYEQMCETAKPDFVFAMGRHCDMAATAEYLMRSGIPFAMEKPCGLNYEEVHRLALLQQELGAFAAVPFVWRQSELVTAIREKIGFDQLRYVLFRRMLGGPQRYFESDCAWMLDPAQAGGGNTLNVGTHWIDLFAHFMQGRRVEVVSAYMSNDLFHYPVEDYSIITLQAGNATCVTDTGYVYPGGAMDLHHSVIGNNGYLIVTGEGVGELSSFDRPAELLQIPRTPDYGRFVAEVLDQAATGCEPIANMQDMQEVMRLTDDAYRLAAGTGERGEQSWTR